MPINYFIAGEKSGDLHGAKLIEELKKQQPELQCKGVGGRSMQANGLIALVPFDDFQVMGFSDVILALPRLIRHFNTLVNHILQDNPEKVIFIDYPGFNLRLAKALRKKGYLGKLIHYIAPSVWAWKKNRIQTMSQTLNLLLTIYPFENAFFQGTCLKTRYVGNPLIEEIKDSHVDRQPLLALFPGSRLNEINRNLPIQIEAAKLFCKEHPEFEVAISISDPSFEKIAQEHLKNAYFPYSFVYENERHSLMQRATLALAKSGTVTLELALSACPTVVMYQLTRLNYFLAKYAFNISLPHYALPNILLNERIFPEYYQMNISPYDLAMSMKKEAQKGSFMGKKAFELKTLLSTQKASESAAKEIISLC